MSTHEVMEVLQTLHFCPGRPYVLVVDSDGLRGRMLLSALRSFGCYAARATTGAEGLRYVRENEPDAVVGDWNLSDMTGPEFARRVKSARFETKVLLQKEGADARSLRKTLECGGEELLERSTPVSRLFRLLSAPVPA